MPSKKISQREARLMKKRVVELEEIEEARRAVWNQDYPGGVNIDQINAGNDSSARSVKVARMLGHAVVAVNAGDIIKFYALPASKR